MRNHNKITRPKHHNNHILLWCKCILCAHNITNQTKQKGGTLLCTTQ